MKPRALIERDGFIEVPLTKGLTAKINYTDRPLIERWSWCARLRKNGRAYAARGTRASSGKFVQVYMHRCILGLRAGDRIGVDHINGDGLDNRRSNIRPSNQSQNLANQKVKKHSSLYKGVTWDARKHRWAARIKVNRKMINLGRFWDETDAASAYNNAANKYFGCFAKLNEITR